MNLPGVKPARDWIDETPGVIHDKEHRGDLCALYKRIAAQAFAAGVQQGMTEAAEVVTQVNTDYDGCADPKGKTLRAILAARDAKIKPTH